MFFDGVMIVFKQPILTSFSFRIEQLLLSHDEFGTSRLAQFRPTMLCELVRYTVHICGLNAYETRAWIFVHKDVTNLVTRLVA